MDGQVCAQRPRGERGFTLFEGLVVMGIIAIVSFVAVPKVLNARRLIRSGGVTQDLVGGLRDARQMAITRRRAITFQYDDAAKQIKIIDHGTDATGLGISGVNVLTNAAYPNTTGSTVASTVLLTASGVPASEIAFGAPSFVSTAAKTLGDKITVAATSALTNQKLNITFQPDGTIIDSNKVPRNVAFAIYNSAAPNGTAAAVSILGATGRIKAWRYSDSAQKFVE